MTEPAELRELLGEVTRAGLCSHPIRLHGETVERRTGEFFSGLVTVACKDRRAVICPACARLYKADAWQLVAAGLRGGKGVPASVGEHPRLFVTLTAVSFGPVHSRAKDGQAPCRPRRSAPVCPHGLSVACTTRHQVDDPTLGEPLCPECFDYRGAVLWNAHASRLWQRTTVGVVRALAKEFGLNEKGLRALARLSFVKVVEFQRRGLVHLHVVVRADGPEGPGTPPPADLDARVLAEAVKRSAQQSSVAAVGGHGRIRWGDQLDIHELRDDEGADAGAVAAYIAVYVTKTSDGAGILARPVRSAWVIDHLKLRPHAARLVRTAWELGGDPHLADLRLRAHAHTFGFPGHQTTKSIRYSTTFSELRQYRRDLAAADSSWEPLEGGWHYAGRGYGHPDAERLAEALHLAHSSLPKDFPPVPSSVPTPLTREDA